MNGEVGFNISSVSEIEESTMKDFTAEQCGFYCKKEFTLKKHVNTKHDRELQDGQIQNNSEKTCKFHCDQCKYSCNCRKV